MFVWSTMDEMTRTTAEAAAIDATSSSAESTFTHSSGRVCADAL